MASYKDPTFSDRIASARLAKDKAIASLKAKPPTDPALLAQRRATADAREAKLSEKRAAKADAARTAAEKAAAHEHAAAAEAGLDRGRKPIATEEERKAARDARYAARKKAKK
jgi:hypothetical protein